MSKVVIRGRRITNQDLSGAREGREESWGVYTSRRTTRYFEREHNHAEWEVGTNQLRVYCFCSNSIKYNIVNTLVYSYTRHELWHCHSCLDFKDVMYSREDGEDAVKITDTKGNLLGIYLIERNVLSLCDFTHEDHGAEELVHFMQFLEDEGIIKPYDVEEDQPIESNTIQVTLGCDPEYEPVVGGEIVRAKNQDFERTVHVGVDGQGDQIEFRPRPASSPDEFVENLRECYEHIAKQGYNLSTVGNVYPLGAHIHVGAGSPKILNPNISKLFDKFLGTRLLSCSGSAREGYKRLGQCREKSHGFEYRSLPTAVFHTPEIAKAVAEVSFAFCNAHYSGKDIEVSERGATLEDMAKLGISEESARAVRFWPAEYKKIAHKSPLSFWLGEEYDDVGTRLRPSITLSDDWHPGASGDFRAVLERHELQGSILLFGLADERGKVTYGYSVEGYSVVTDTFNSQEGRALYVFGVPHNIRTGRCTATELLAHANEVLRQIKYSEEE